MNVSDLVTAVLAHAPTAPDPLVARLLVDAAREFCEETRYWVDDTIMEDAVASQGVYTPTLPAGAVVVDVKEIEFNGNPLIPATPAQLSREYGDTWRTAVNTPVHFMRSAASAARIVPAAPADDAAAIRFTLELKPAFAATTLDDSFAEPYSETLVNGALSRLFAIADKPWSSTPKADRYLTLFYSKFDEAREKADSNRTRNVPRKVKYRD